MNKIQITVTLDSKHAKFITSIARALYEGNNSQALRHILNDYAKLTDKQE